MISFANFEPLLPDQRVLSIEDEFKSLYPQTPDGTVFLSYIQPGMEVKTESGASRPIPDVAVFAVLSPHPRQKQHLLLTKAAIWLKDWRDDDKAYQHLVGVPDPARKFFRLVLGEHLKQIDNLKQLN